MIVALGDLTLRLGAVLTAVIVLAVVFGRAPRASITLVLFATVLTESREWPFPASTDVATFNVSVFDVFTVLLGAVGLSRRGWHAVARPGRGAMLTIAALTAIGIVSWTLVEGLQVSVNFWRQWMFPVAACWYAASWPVLRSRAGLQPFVWAALLGSFTQAFGFALRGFGSIEDGVIINGALASARPITASVALLILFGAVLLTIDRRPGNPLTLLPTAWLWASVLVSQHRSVWVAGIVACVLLAYAMVKGSRQRLVTATFVGIGLVGTGVLISRLVRSQADLSVAARDYGSLQWRIENWAEKLTVPRDPVEWLFGSAFGPTPVTERFQSMLQFQVSAHSMPIDTLSALGLVGLMAVVLIAIVSIRVPLRRSNLWILAAALVAYGFFYSWPQWSWLMLGVSMAATDRSGQATPSRPHGVALVALV